MQPLDARLVRLFLLPLASVGIAVVFDILHFFIGEGADGDEDYFVWTHGGKARHRVALISIAGRARKIKGWSSLHEIRHLPHLDWAFIAPIGLDLAIVAWTTNALRFFGLTEIPGPVLTVVILQFMMSIPIVIVVGTMKKVPSGFRIEAYLSIISVLLGFSAMAMSYVLPIP